MKLSKKNLRVLIEQYLYEGPEGSEAEQADEPDEDSEEKTEEAIEDLEFDIGNKQYKITKTDNGGYDVMVMSGSGKNELVKISSKDVGNDIKDYLGQWTSGAISAKKNNPEENTNLSKETIQKWIEHIGKDQVNRANLVAFRGIEQNLNKNSV